PSTHGQSAAPRTNRVHGREAAELEALREEMIAQAVQESSRILEEAHTRLQADYEAMHKQAAQEAEQARQQAYMQGRAEGLQEQKAALAQCVQALQAGIAKMEGAQASFITGYEQDLKWLAIEIAEKVLCKKISQDETEMTQLIKNAVETVKNANWLTVEVSEQMPNLITALQQELQSAANAANIDVKSICAPRGTCIIDTPEGFLDVSIDTQLENLKDYFKLSTN
ncbi:MAG: FliH/SctL family protein, partial [Oscillospiraceae bacterium]|nr:FliH/SctL family protein [Oscillospiraceae bacterium]